MIGRMITEPSNTHDRVHSLAGKIRRAEARVTVVGLGYVGLPLALTLAGAGFPVDGLDVDPRKVASLLDGASYIDDLSDGEIAGRISSGRFTPTTDPAVLRAADAV